MRNKTEKISFAIVLALVLLVPFSQAVIFRTGASDGATFIPGVTETFIPTTITLNTADGTAPPVTQQANTPPNFATNFNAQFGKTYKVQYTAPGFKTDVDDYFFDLKLQSCVAGSNCNMVTQQFSTACVWNSTFSDWVCKVNDTETNQWITFVYNRNDPVWGEVIRGFTLLFPDIPGNLPPVLNPIGNRVVNEGQTLVFTVSATDPNGDPVTFDTGNIAPLPPGAVFSGNTFSWTPNFNQAGTYQVTVFARDPFGAFDRETVTITVIDVVPPVAVGNQPPVFVSTPVTVADLNVQYRYDADAVDPDNDALVFSLERAPSGMTINPVTGLVTWIPSSSQEGRHEIVIAVTDGRFVVRQRYTLKAGVTVSVIARKLLKLTRISAVGECYNPGSEVPVFTAAENKADRELDDVSYVASIPQLGLRRSAGPFDMKSERGAARQVFLELPKDAAEGEYNVRVVMSNDDVRRVRNRPIVVAGKC